MKHATFAEGDSKTAAAMKLLAGQSGYFGRSPESGEMVGALKR